ncbi:MAG: tyrosine--tRNA ligase [Alphaproteobacteria bacterium]|nr:tyrosine--tRNA ligase [Alphaproteobacteria bacterium]
MKNELLHELEQRGFIYQTSNIDALSDAMNVGPITAYWGTDPTGDSLHVGHLASLMLLRWFRKSGHNPIALVGGATGRIGDPSERDAGRPMLSDRQIENNLAGLRRSIEKILPGGILVVDNYDWQKSYNHLEFLREYGTLFTIPHMLSMESVKRRMEHGLTFLEFNYMTIQAVDFLELYNKHNCVLQLCGADQWGNSIMGVELIRKKLQKEAFVLSTPLITDSSGEKIGKSAGNAVWINEDKTSTYDYYQYFRNVADTDVEKFLKIYTEIPLAEIMKLSALKDKEINEAKKILAFEATKIAHGEAAAKAAEEAAAALFAGGAESQNIPTFMFDSKKSLKEYGFKPDDDVLDENIQITVFLVMVGLVKSNSEARRLIEQGGLMMDGNLVTDANVTFVTATPGKTIMLQKGKKTFLKVVIK